MDIPYFDRDSFLFWQGVRCPGLRDFTVKVLRPKECSETTEGVRPVSDFQA